MSTDSRSARSSMIRKGLLAVLVLVLVGAAYGFYLYNMPKRDVQATVSDARIDAGALAQEFLNNGAAANAKYLDAEGESKVLEVSGTVKTIDTDLSGQRVVLLETGETPAGVRCTFLTSTNAEGLNVGDVATIKGVIRAGAAYDADLELYEHVVLEKCALVK